MNISGTVLAQGPSDTQMPPEGALWRCKRPAASILLSLPLQHTQTDPFVRSHKQLRGAPYISSSLHCRVRIVLHSLLLLRGALVLLWCSLAIAFWKYPVCSVIREAQAKVWHGSVQMVQSKRWLLDGGTSCQPHAF